MAALAPHPPRALAAAPIGLAARALGATWRMRWSGREALAGALADGPVIYAFWHGEQLPLAVAHRDQGVAGLASRSRDGALLAGVIARLGYAVVRGSSSSGGALGLRGCARALADGRSVALAVDGPRGPRHSVAPGVAALARLSGRPVACATATASTALRLRSWDRFVVPAPGAAVAVRYALVEAAGLDTAAGQAAVRAALLGLTAPSAPAP